MFERNAQSGGRIRILYSIDTICGGHDLSVADLSAGEYSIWTGYFDRVAHEPESGTVLVAVGNLTGSSLFERGEHA
jgi:hypothetical protein